MIDAVVDTNVAVTANGQACQASMECRRTCIRELEELKQNGRIFIDEGYRIIREYRDNLNVSGQPGPGDAFLLWILQNYKNPDRCVIVPTTVDPDDNTNYLEFPTDPELRLFDRSDRIFAVVAKRRSVSVWNAVDKHWWNFRYALERNGIHILFICSDQFQ